MNATEYMKHWQGKQVWKNLVLPKHQNRLRKCAEFAIGESFIDVGCACGHSTDHMARLGAAGKKWTGMDFDAGAIDEARNLFPDIEFIYSPDYEMAAAAGGRTFDTVICSEVIEHVADESGFIRGLASLATRRIVLTTPNVAVNDPGHLRLYTRETLEKTFTGLHPRILPIGRFFFFFIVIDLEKIK
jgi:2-polyprenyl-3-methyl-5-hydroxy-6-metoxy-1,4-benzoquinol methylase